MSRRRLYYRAPAGILRAESQLRLHRLTGEKVTWGSLPIFWGGRLTIDASGEIAIGDRFQAHCRPVASRISSAPGATLLIGDRVMLNYGVEVYAGMRVSIGDDSRVGELTAIFDTNFHQVEEDESIDSRPVRIGRNVWIGRGVTILPGATIGDHSVVAAGSVVRDSFPDRCLVAGSPAKVVRDKLQAAKGWRRR